MNLAERQARAILKNKRTKRPVSGDEPSAKRQVTGKAKGRTLPFKEAQLKVIVALLGCTSFVDPLTGKAGLYSALTQEPSYFYTFPLLLQAPQKKKNLNGKDHKTLSGAPRPELIFTVINKSFSIVYPEKEAQMVVDWELYKWNVAYYGSGIAKRAPQWSELKEKVEVLRSLGGDKNPVQVNVFTEVGSSKSGYAIDIRTVLPEEDTMTRDFLLGLKEDATKLAESGKILLVDKDDLEAHVSNREEESGSDEEEESYESSDEE